MWSLRSIRLLVRDLALATDVVEILYSYVMTWSLII